MSDAYDYVSIELRDIPDLCLVCLTFTSYDWSEKFGVGWEGE